MATPIVNTVSSVETTFAVVGKHVLTVLAQAKIFSTGSRGFHTQGKVEIAGKRYQYNVILTEIGSKPQ